MATSKAKRGRKPAAKSGSKSSKPSTTAKAEKVEKKAVVSVEKTDAKTKTKTKTVKETPVVITSKAEDVATNSKFFGRKFDANENILTIFKDTKIVGAILAEIFGVMLVTMIVLTLGLANPLYLIFGYVGITLAVFHISGANLNPIITAGMLATRRMSAIRGVLYFIAQILGAWFGFLVINHFFNLGIAAGVVDEASGAMPALTAAANLSIASETFDPFWMIVTIEFIGAVIIAFFYARALVVKKNAFAFSALVGMGVFTALLIAVVTLSNFFYLSESVTIMNPAISMVYGVFPASAEGFDALMAALMPMLVTYVIFPIIGGIVGFYLSDIMSKLSHKELAN